MRDELSMASGQAASPGNLHGPAGGHGFTLVEMLVTLSILAILAALAVPSFNELALRSKLNSISNSFIGSAQLARSEAIKRNRDVTLCAALSREDQTSCGDDWSNGWVVVAEGVPIASHGPLSNLYEMSGGATSIDFQPSGMIPACTELTLKNTQYTSTTKTMAVHVTGRASTKDSCS